MSRAPFIALSLVVLLAIASPAAAKEPNPDPDGAVAALPEPGEVIPGEVVVGFRDVYRGRESIRSRGLDVRRLLESPALIAAVVDSRGRAVSDVLAELRADPAIAFAEPNYLVRLADEGTVTAVAVSDPKTGDQYSLDRMRVRNAWAATHGGSNVIAVLDTGVQAGHGDLIGRVLPGRDFVNDDTNAADDNGHGTWVAGIIAANANDGYGMAGISWTDKILPVKMMNSNGTGSSADLAAGLVWAADKGADVINMSVGGFPYSQAVQNAVNYAWNKGAVLVGAAGNNRREEVFYPASFDNVVSVSATQNNDEFSNWSSWGPKVDVSAPGSSVLTTNCTAGICPHPDWGSHTLISGTSFATPNVAGVIALIRAKYPSFTPQQVVDRLRNTADDLGYAGWDPKYGRGRVNAERAVGGIAVGGWPSRGDGLEPNNALAAAASIPLATATSATIHPAGDIDYFAVDVPRAGRLDVRVTGVVDSRPWPWHGTSLPVDPIVALYDAGGTLIKTVDSVWESGTELAQVHVGGPTRIYVRVTNWYANGSKTALKVTPTYVDTAAPTAALTNPTTGSTGVSRFVDPVVTFNEPVSNANADHVFLRDMTTSVRIPITVSYDAASRTAKLRPVATRLEPNRTYRAEVGSGVVDSGGNSVVSASRTFTTGTASFADTAGNPFEADIEWLLASGITGGCSVERFCPASDVHRDAMAAFLSRALALVPTDADYFSDDTGNLQEPHINRIAEVGVTNGCSAGRFCPAAGVTRAQMATFLARALALPPATADYFDDDNGNRHEDDINRLAEAGIASGCDAGMYCPLQIVSREQMAAYLHRSIGG